MSRVRLCNLQYLRTRLAAGAKGVEVPFQALPEGGDMGLARSVAPPKSITDHGNTAKTGVIAMKLRKLRASFKSFWPQSAPRVPPVFSVFQGERLQPMWSLPICGLQKFDEVPVSPIFKYRVPDGKFKPVYSNSIQSPPKLLIAGLNPAYDTPSADVEKVTSTTGSGGQK